MIYHFLSNQRETDIIDQWNMLQIKIRFTIGLQNSWPELKVQKLKYYANKLYLAAAAFKLRYYFRNLMVFWIILARFGYNGRRWFANRFCGPHGPEHQRHLDPCCNRNRLLLSKYMIDRFLAVEMYKTTNLIIQFLATV